MSKWQVCPYQLLEYQTCKGWRRLTSSHPPPIPPLFISGNRYWSVLGLSTAEADMMMINLLLLLLDIIVLLILLLLLLLLNLLLIFTFAGACAATRESGQPAARRTAAERAYAGGQLFISVYDILSVLYILCTLYVSIIYNRGGTCVCASNRQGTWPRCRRKRRCRCSQRCGRGAKCRNVIPGDPSTCVCKCRIRTQNYVNGRSIEKATYDML